MSPRPYIQGDVWFLGDLHLGHRNIIRYCDRPFASLEEHDEALVAQWCEVVRPNDTMFFLGDLSLGKPEHVLPWIERLTGNLVYLLEGNHDKRTLRRLARAGQLPDNMRVVREFEIKLDAHRVLLTHHPLDVLPEGVALNVHGHCHGKSRRPLTTHLDVSWDVFRRPIRWQEIRTVIEEKRLPDPHDSARPRPAAAARPHEER